MKTWLKRYQQRPWISHGSASVVRPIYRIAHRICSTVPWVVKVNGGHVKCDEVDLVFPPDTGIMYSTLPYWRGSAGYESATWNVLRQLLRGCSAFLDIGSNIGLYTVLARKLVPDLVVDAFEPVPSLAESNRRFHVANGLSPDAVRQVAISDTSGQGCMRVPKYSHLREVEPTSTLQRGVHLSPGASESEEVVAKQTIDHFLAENERPDRLLLKIDVEGHELEVLMGALYTLKERRPVVVIEILPEVSRPDEIGALLAPLAYTLWAISREGLFRVAFVDLSGPRSFTDFLLLPCETHAAESSYMPYSALDCLRI